MSRDDCSAFADLTVLGALAAAAPTLAIVLALTGHGTAGLVVLLVTACLAVAAWVAVDR